MVTAKVVAVSGSRTLTGQEEQVWAAFLDGLAEVAIALDVDQYSKAQVRYLHGGARGVDQIVAHALLIRGVPVAADRADWTAHGRRAGIIRNERMVGAADALVAVWDGQSTGTRHAIVVARQRGIPVAVRIVAVDPDA